jgi:polysaccharide chain length determinant protein (PEP-CTERM system associated)
MEQILEQVFGILRGVWRYRWIAMIVAWVICLLAWPVILVLPNKYEAGARVFVDPSTALRPVIQGIAIEQDVNAELNLVRQSLLSGPQLQKIVEQTGLDAGAVNPAQRARAVDELRSRLEIAAQINQGSPAEGGQALPSRVYQISYQDQDQDRALKVVKILLDNFMEGTLSGKRRGSMAAQRFVEDQIRDYETRLNEAEQRLADFKKKNVGMVPGDQTNDYFTRLQNEMDAVKKADTQLGIAMTRRNALTQQLRGEAPIAASGGVAATTGPSGTLQAGGDTLSRIKETQAKLDELLLRFTDRHPDVIALRETLEQLKQRRATELDALRRGDPNAAATTGASSNPVYQSIQLALNQADVEIAGLRGELNDHQSKVADLRRMVDTMPQVEAEFARLNRDYTVTKTQYTALVERLEKARLGEEAEATGSVRFEVIDPPSVGFKPVSPRRALLLAATLAGGIAVGLGVAYLLSLLNPVFHSARQLSERTGVLVLGMVSAFRAPGDALKLRRDVIGYSAAFVLLVCAAGGVVLFAKVHGPLTGLMASFNGTG